MSLALRLRIRRQRRIKPQPTSMLSGRPKHRNCRYMRRVRLRLEHGIAHKQPWLMNLVNYIVASSKAP